MMKIIVSESVFTLLEYKKQGEVAPDGTYIDVEIEVTVNTEVIDIIKHKYPYWYRIGDNGKKVYPDKTGEPNDGHKWFMKYGTDVEKVKKIIPKIILQQHRLLFTRDKYGSGEYYIKTNGNKLIGTALLADSLDEKSSHVSNVYISKEFRGLGVANAFYDYIEKTIKKPITRDSGIFKTLSGDGARMWDRRIGRKIDDNSPKYD